MEFNTLEKDKIFIPKIKDNNKLPPKKQMRVIFRSFPNTEQTRIGLTAVRREDESGRAYLAPHVEKIENLKVGGKDIKSIADLFNCETSAVDMAILVNEVWNYCFIEDGEVSPGEESASE